MDSEYLDREFGHYKFAIIHKNKLLSLSKLFYSVDILVLYELVKYIQTKWGKIT